MLTHNPIGMGADYWRAYYLGRQLVQKGHSITLVGSPAADGNATSEQLGGLSIYAVPGRWRSLGGRTGYSPVEVIGRLVRLQSEQFDLIHTFGHRPVVSLVGQWLKLRTRIPQVADWSDLWGRGGISDERRPAGRMTVGLLDHLLERQNILAADGVAVVSHFLQQRAQAWGKSSERVFRLGAGAAVDVIKPIPKHQARKKLGITIGRHLFAHSGQSAFNRAHVRAVGEQILRHDSDSSIVMLGAGRRGEIADVDPHSQIIQLGYLSQPDMGIALGASDIVLMPLQDRGFNRARMPNRLGDAASAGRPIVTNPTGDVGKLVKEERLGIVVDEDPATMAAAAIELVMDQEKVEEIGQGARRIAETKLSWTLLAKRLESFYESLPSS